MAARLAVVLLVCITPELADTATVEIACTIVDGQYQCQQINKPSSKRRAARVVSARASEANCPATCGIRNRTCDELFDRELHTCQELQKLGCDCGGCKCNGDGLHPDWTAAINQSNDKVFYYNGQTLETSYTPRSQNICPKTCHMLGHYYSCDALWLDYTCEHLELGGCDCSGCDCKATTLSVFMSSRPNTEEECARTCSVPGGFHTYSCNDLQWLYKGTTCATLEERGCDCSGCLCGEENAMMHPDPPEEPIPRELNCPGNCKLHGGQSTVEGFGFSCDQLYFLYSFSQKMSCEALEESGCDCTGCRYGHV